MPVAADEEDTRTFEATSGNTEQGHNEQELTMLENTHSNTIKIVRVCYDPTARMISLAEVEVVLAKQTEHNCLISFLRAEKIAPSVSVQASTPKSF